MNYTYTLENIISSIRRKKAVAAFDLMAYCGFTLRYIGGGRYRNVYQIVGSQYIIKVPIMQSGSRAGGHRNVVEASRAHARAEYAMYRRIKRSRSKYKDLQPYIPDEMSIIHDTGVIVTKKLRALGRGGRREMNKVTDAAKVAVGKYCDLHDANFMRDQEGKLKIVDLGYFLTNKDFKKKAK